MQKVFIDASAHMYYKFAVDTAISFKPFIDFLEKKILEEKTVKASFYQHVLSRFEQYKGYDKEIELEDLHTYDELMELIYACLSPAISNESNFLWGLTLPLRPAIFYGTESLYNLITTKEGFDINSNLFPQPEGDFDIYNLQFIYSFILKKWYGFSPPVRFLESLPCKDNETGLTKYYQFTSDPQFVELEVNGELPELDFKNLYLQLSEKEGYQKLLKDLPLNIFRFKGFSMLYVTDVTEEQAIQNIKQIIINHSTQDEREHYQSVIQTLKDLVQDNQIEFELFSFLKVNDKLVYGYEKGGSSVLNSIWGEKRLSLDRFSHEAQSYASNPSTFFSKDINKESNPFLDLFKVHGVRSLALNPIFLNEVPVGVLGIYTYGNKTFEEKSLAVVEKAVPTLAQLLKIYIDGFNQELEVIIKEKFTSIQSTVQWKFNEVAWHYLYDRKKNLQSRETEPIVFKDVFPLYGAIDIRNSSIERNTAVKADLQKHLALLLNTLDLLKSFHASALLDEINYKCKKWTKLIEEDLLSANDENSLSNFLEEDIVLFLNHFAQTYPNSGTLIQGYFSATNEINGEVYNHRRNFEISLNKITTALNRYIEEEKTEIQKIFPCYFEKFKTDGIEYDIYIGQSLTPYKVFSTFHLKDLRLWQLRMMAAVANLTKVLVPEMAKPLHTTQLIFAHNKTIDISFRNDERRFDVEGAYNIRYQMIKKRIDKVRVKSTNERLTQPDKIAIVYFNKNDVEDYLEFIAYLQETKVLEDNLEELVLEDLQGVHGLKALRVGVVMRPV